MGSKYPQWEPWEDDYIRAFYPHHGAHWPGRGLRSGWKCFLADRTELAIQHRAAVLGIKYDGPKGRPAGL